MKTNNFDFIAKKYELLSSLVFGSILRKSQLHYLNLISNQSSVLLVGEGSGVFLEKLIQKSNCKKIVIVEPSKNMIGMARKRIERLKSDIEIVFINEPLEKVKFNEKFDCIVTNFFLDLFEKPKLLDLMKKLKPILHENSIWIFTDYSLNNSSLHRFWQAALMKIMYQFFAIVAKVEGRKLLDFSIVFDEIGMQKTGQKTFYCRMIETAVYEQKPS